MNNFIFGLLSFISLSIFSAKCAAERYEKIFEDENRTVYIDIDSLVVKGVQVEADEMWREKIPLRPEDGLVDAVSKMLYDCEGYSYKTLSTRYFYKDNRVGKDGRMGLLGNIRDTSAAVAKPRSLAWRALDYVCNLDEINITKKAQVKIADRDKVKLVKDSGVYEVPVVLNDTLRINFIVDSGAADVSISPDVASTLVKTGTVGYNDWLPGMYYKFADGSYAKSRRFIIRRMKIGNTILSNVSCSIANSVDAPMLLGQSALEKLGSYSVDYRTGYLFLR